MNKDLDLKKIKRMFFIGIGGIGISALAKMAISCGIEVGGVNDEEGKTVDSLIELGVDVIMSKVPFDIPEADLYVYSDAWLYRGPEIIEEAKKTGKPVLSYFKVLGQFARNYKVIAVSGTHGKTTTTAMIADIMIDAGFDPTVIVGSFVKKFNSNFRKGNSEYLVVEADEYNRHFLNFAPFIAVVTNIEADHLDCYKDLDDIRNAFADFLSFSEHKITEYEKYLKKVPPLLVPGIHNRKNAAAALSVAEILNIPEEVAKKSLSQFTGTWRRLEKRGTTKEGTVLYDDYAHHPTEIMASLEGLRELYPSKKITVVFQPHLYSRTKALFDDFAKSFKDADFIVLLPIYFAREAKDESVSSEKLAEAIKKNGDEAVALGDFREAEEYLGLKEFNENDVFVTMGAGEAYKIAEGVFKDTFWE